jgi:hypothetical protein
VATELATNLVKHARGGEVLLRTTPDAVGELEILAIDRGPGIANLSVSFEDGRSTTGTSGIGLGAARRMSDEFDLYSGIPHGTVVLARIRARTAAARRPLQFSISGVSVAKSSETECGDASTLKCEQDGSSALVADGLGHGHFRESRPRATAPAAARRSSCAFQSRRSASRRRPKRLPDSRHVAPRAGRGEQDPVVPEGSFPVEDRLFLLVGHQVAASPGFDDHLGCLRLEQVAVEPLDYNLVLSRAD